MNENAPTNEALSQRVEALERRNDFDVYNALLRVLKTKNLEIGSAPSSTSIASGLISLNSISKGMIFSRMTTAQRDAIVNPVAGLVIYNTSTGALNVYDGSGWDELSAGGSVAGSDSQIQYNNGGALGGDAQLTWDDVNDKLVIAAPSGVAVTDIYGANGANTIETRTLTGKPGHSLNIAADAGDNARTGGSPTGGTVAIAGGAGDSSSAGGNVTLTAGDGGASGGAGGAVEANAGDAVGGDDDGGTITLAVGAKAGAGEDGDVVTGRNNTTTTRAGNFLFIPTSAGAPTGTPRTTSGRVAIVFDTTNNKLMVYDGAWIGVTLS